MEGNIFFFPTSLILVMPTDSQEYLFEFNNWASNTLFFNLNRNVFIERNTTVYNFLESYLYQKVSPLRCQFYFLGFFFFVHWKCLYRQTCNMETFNTKSRNVNTVPTTVLAKKAESDSSKCWTFFRHLVPIHRMSHALSIYGCKYTTILILALSLLRLSNV